MYNLLVDVTSAWSPSAADEGKVSAELYVSVPATVVTLFWVDTPIPS